MVLCVHYMHVYMIMGMQAHWDIKSQQYRVSSSIASTLIWGAGSLTAHEAHYFRLTGLVVTPKELLVSI